MPSPSWDVLKTELGKTRAGLTQCWRQFVFEQEVEKRPPRV